MYTYIWCVSRWLALGVPLLLSPGFFLVAWLFDLPDFAIEATAKSDAESRSPANAARLQTNQTQTRAWPVLRGSPCLSMARKCEHPFLSSPGLYGWGKQLKSCLPLSSVASLIYERQIYRRSSRHYKNKNSAHTHGQRTKHITITNRNSRIEQIGKTLTCTSQHYGDEIYYERAIDGTEGVVGFLKYLSLSLSFYLTFLFFFQFARSLVAAREPYL